MLKWASNQVIIQGNQTSQDSRPNKQIESPCLKRRYPLIDQLNVTFSLTSVQAWSSKSPAESPICGPAFFTCVPTRSARLAFYLFVKIWFFEKSWSRHLFYFYFWRENKTRNKTLKKWLHKFWKSVSLKNPSLSPGIRLPIGKVPLKGSTPLSPIKVSTNKVKGSVAINQLIMDT